MYVFSTFMAVFCGRELTLNRGSGVVIASFLLSFLAFNLTILASNKKMLYYIAKKIVEDGGDKNDHAYGNKHDEDDNNIRHRQERIISSAPITKTLEIIKE